MKESRNPNPGQEEGDGQRKLPVTLDAFDIVREALTAVAGNTARVRQALLACDEWIANVVNHSKAKALSFTCRLDGKTLHVCFSDDGIPFDPMQRVGTVAEFDALDLGGMGLALIRECAADITYERVNEQNILHLRFDLDDVETQKKEDSAK